MWQPIETRCVAQAAFSGPGPAFDTLALPQPPAAAAVVIRLARLGSTFNNIDIDTRIDDTTERHHHCGSENQDDRFIVNRRYRTPPFLRPRAATTDAMGALLSIPLMAVPSMGTVRSDSVPRRHGIAPY
jgi:hypothetical protein